MLAADAAESIREMLQDFKPQRPNVG
jgi:hypothetical protein